MYNTDNPIQMDSQTRTKKIPLFFALAQNPAVSLYAAYPSTFITIWIQSA